MSVSRKGLRFLAILFMMLFLAALVLYALASGKSARILGPGQLATNGAGIYVHANDELLEASTDGTLLRRLPLDAAQWPRWPVDLHTLGDGRLLVADAGPARLLACEITATLRCETVGARLADIVDGRFSLVPDAAPGSLLIADAANPLIWRLPLAGGDPEALAQPPELHGVDALLRDAEGLLWAADAGQRRILVLRATGEGDWQVERELSTAGEAVRRGNDRPTVLAMTGGGELWAVQTNLRGSDADLMVYDRATGAAERIALPDGAVPTDIVSNGDAVIVSDTDNYRLYRVDAHAKTVEDFGDAGLAAALRDSERARQLYRSRMHGTLGAMALFGVLMIAAAVWATPKGRRWTRRDSAAPIAASDAPMPRIEGIHWLARNRTTDRFLTWARFGGYVVFLLLIVSAVMMFNLMQCAATHVQDAEDLARLGEARYLFAMLLVTVAAVPLLLRLGLRTLRVTLGTDGSRLYVRAPDGREQSFAPEQLVYGSRAILYRNQVFATQTGKRQPLYAPGEVETYLAPLLKRAQRLGPLDLLRHQLKYREATLIASLLLLAILGVGAAATGLWRTLLA